METNQGTNKELASNVESALKQNQHRYQLHDPHMETTFRFNRADEAQKKAEELGATRFQHVTADGSIQQVDKVDGQWYMRAEPTPPQKRMQPPSPEDKPLAAAQKADDIEAIREIEARAALREKAAGRIDPQLVQNMATADAHAFRRIENPDLQAGAAAMIADNARDIPDYKTALDKAIPGYPGAAEQIKEAMQPTYAEQMAGLKADIADQNTNMHQALREMSPAQQKEAGAAEPPAAPAAPTAGQDKDFKTEEYSRAQAERIGEAKKWTPEAAANNARLDANLLAQSGDDWTRNAQLRDMARFADANPHYLAALKQEHPKVAEQVNELRDAMRQQIDSAALDRATRDADAFDTPKREVIENSITDGREYAQTPAEAAHALLTRHASIEDVAKLDDKTAAQLARDDVADMRQSKDLASAELIAAALRDSPAYRAEFVKTDSGLAQDVVAQVAGQDLDQAKGREGDRQERFENLKQTVDSAAAEVESKIPPALESRYVTVQEGATTAFYDRNAPKAVPEFTDKGKSLTTSTNDKTVAADMVKLAASKGWTPLQVKGSEEFRRQAWLEASVQGIGVKGFKPKEADLALLKAMHAERQSNKIEVAPATGPSRSPAPEPMAKPAPAQTTPQHSQAESIRSLSTTEKIKVAAAEKVFLHAVRGLPSDEQQKLLSNLQQKLADPANVNKLPTPKHYTKDHEAGAGASRQSNRER